MHEELSYNTLFEHEVQGEKEFSLNMRFKERSNKTISVMIFECVPIKVIKQIPNQQLTKHSITIERSN